jgi:hypothetical protein
MTVPSRSEGFSINVSKCTEAWISSRLEVQWIGLWLAASTIGVSILSIALGVPFRHASGFPVLTEPPRVGSWSLRANPRKLQASERTYASSLPHGKLREPSP